MRFKYPYAQIVRLKETERTQSEWILSNALGHLMREEESMGQLQVTKRQLENQLLTVAAQQGPIAELMHQHEYITHIDGLIKHKQDDIHTAKQDVNQKQNQLSDKMMQEKMWNNIKQKAWDEHRLNEQRKEQAEIDEIAASRKQNSIEMV